MTDDLKAIHAPMEIKNPKLREPTNILPPERIAEIERLVYGGYVLDRDNAKALLASHAALQAEVERLRRQLESVDRILTDDKYQPAFKCMGSVELHAFEKALACEDKDAEIERLRGERGRERIEMLNQAAERQRQIDELKGNVHELRTAIELLAALGIEHKPATDEVTVDPATCPCSTCADARPNPHFPGLPFSSTRMVVCEHCGCKRCPHATHHDNPCTGSNAPGQPGSRYTATPAANDPQTRPGRP